MTTADPVLRILQFLRKTDDCSTTKKSCIYDGQEAGGRGGGDTLRRGCLLVLAGRHTSSKTVSLRGCPFPCHCRLRTVSSLTLEINRTGVQNYLARHSSYPDTLWCHRTTAIVWTESPNYLPSARPVSFLFRSRIGVAFFFGGGGRR